MFDYYFAGCCPVEPLIENDCNILRSYLNDKKDIQTFFEARKNGWKGKMMIDNGAFSVHRKNGLKIDIDEYIDWINANHENFDYCVALDEIPGEWGKPRTAEQIKRAVEVTRENYLYMVERVVCPEKLLPVVHMADGIEVLRKTLELPVKYICISGSKDVPASQRSAWYRQCFDIISKVRPDVKVHCLGSGTLRDVVQFPFTSTDSTTYIKASSVGELCTDYGRIYVGEDLSKKRHAYNTPEIKKYIEEKCKQYGLDMEGLTARSKYVRFKFNVCYYLEKSKEIETQYYECKLRSNMLI